MSNTRTTPGIGHNAPVRTRLEPPADYDDGLLAAAGPIMMLCYVGALAIAAHTFFASGHAFFSVIVSTGFAVLYFTLPLLLGRTRNARDQRWYRDTPQRTSAEVDLWTGPVPRREGIVQIISVPVAVLLGFAAFAVIWTLTA
jgi:hypothetical protein